MEGVYSFDLPLSSAINSDASSSPAKYYGHVYSFDFPSPQPQHTSFSGDFLGFSSHNLASSLFQEPQRNFIPETHAISSRAFTAVGKQKSAQGDDVLPQIPVSIYSNLSPAQSSKSVFSSPNALRPSLLPQAWIDETPADGRAGSPTGRSLLPFSSSQIPAYTYDLAYTHAGRSAYNTLRALLSTPGSSRRSKISSNNIDSTSCFLPSGSAIVSTSSLIDNMASFVPDESKQDICDATLGTNQSDISPVIRKPESPREPSFRLRPADFLPVNYTNDDDFSIPETEKYPVNSVCKDVDFSPFILQTPKKSRTIKYAATAALVAHSPLTPMTDDGRISDPSSMKVMDNLPQNPSSSLAMNNARKRSFDFLDTLTPSYPPKRARSNRLLALKEKERFAAGKDDNDSSDAFYSLEKPSTANQTPIALVPRKTRANFTRQPTGSSSTSSATPSSSSSSSTDSLAVFSQRTLPSLIVLDNKSVPLEISDDIFPLFYRRFPASSYFKLQDQDSSECAIFKKPHPGGTYNPPRNAFDLYTPRFVKGKGKDKMGVCPICIEDIERGGQGKKVWLAMKYSAYNYHMQYSHGISASSSYPFSPPLAFRITTRSTNHKSEKTRMKEGKCHNCLKWVPVEGIKDVEVKVKELFWWKHAATCHASTTIQGEADVFEEDEVYAKLKELGPAAEERKR